MDRVVYIALLRGVNVGGRNAVPMPELRRLCTGLGWEDVQSYIQSGNLVFRAPGAANVAAALERAIAERFGFPVDVIVRRGEDWPAYVASNPFPESSDIEPNLVMLALSKEPPKPDAAAKLLEKADLGERVLHVGDALWIHFPKGAARSRLSSALLDRCVGSPVTTRNWRTVLKLADMALQAGYRRPR